MNCRRDTSTCGYAAKLPFSCGQQLLRSVLSLNGPEKTQSFDGLPHKLNEKAIYDLFHKGLIMRKIMNIVGHRIISGL